jgi:cytochrome c553
VNSRNPIFALLSVVVLASVSRAAEPVAVTPEAAAFFEKEVRPVLAEHCYRCHGETKQKHHLRLDSLAALVRGGDGGPALVVGKPEESLLLKAIRYQDGLKMPPDKPLPKHQIDALATWIAMGAPWPGAGKIEIKRNEFTITDKDREHWSFRPVHRPAVPSVKDGLHVANPIDAFILARLEAQGIAPSAPAGKRELIRRVTFDLVGLPPSPEEIDAFVNDTSPTAYE